jgi:hypothetical protein
MQGDVVSERNTRMSSSPRPTRSGPTRALRLALVGASAAALGLAVVPAEASSPVQHAKRAVVDASHPYRHGLIPTVEGTKNSALGIGLPIGLPISSQLSYGGGNGGVGVTTGAPKVYLVFWGSQWGTSGTNASGYTTLSNDPAGAAPVVQGFFKGLGTNSEGWSKVMTQYCEGVSSGATTCPASAAHVGYPTGGALAGVWYDNSAAAPSQATSTQLGQEAVNAAAHFGNTTAATNRNAEYAILSPTGTHPDGFNTTSSTWCAWHDWTGDVSVNSPYGGIAFANDPYQLDMGSSCGQNFVNSGTAGNTDGFTMVFGHEYSETITDQFPAGGWTDFQGQENADKCAWISSGQGAAANLTLSTGKYAVQSTWGNDFNNNKGGCEITHA